MSSTILKTRKTLKKVISQKKDINIEKINKYLQSRLDISIHHINDIEDDNCLIIKESKNKITINNTSIDITKYIDYGATSKVFEAINEKNKIKYVLKFMSLSQDEINIMEFVSKFVLNNTTPHFVILYKSLLCNMINDTDIDKLDITNNKYPKNFKDYLKTINYFLSNYKYSLLIMEFFDGNIASLLYKYYITYDINDQIDLYKKNAIHAQIYIAILTFHKYINCFHNDAQYKNFFYKKIDYSDNDYFFYNIFSINIYVKNIGLLIVLGDYGFSKHINTISSDKIQSLFINDYNFINDAELINNHSILLSLINERDFFNHLFNNTSNMFFKELPTNGICINKIPYII